MEENRIRELLEQVRIGDVGVEAAVEKLRDLPFEDIGFAMLDHHRSLRNGYPEVIFGLGKDTAHVISIAERLRIQSSKVLATRITPEVAVALESAIPGTVYHRLARIAVIPGTAEDATPRNKPNGTVLVVSAGTADVPVAEEAVITCQEMGSHTERLYDVGVAGIHRLLDKRDKLVAANVVIVVAGMEGALASVVGGLVRRPVVAVPTSVGYGASFQGLSALLTMLNSCASGVAVMNIDNGFGAGYFAHTVNMSG